MPCPHNEITIVQRSQRQSAVAAAAYQSGEKLFCEYDQQVKHYPEKRGIVHNEILLPANAPRSYADRNTLWNAAEAVEKQWNSQLARRWVLTIPREIPPDQYAVLVREFCEQQFVSKGMIADFAIHDPHPPGHNPHAHVLLTMRAMDEHGKWLPKSRKVYDLDENGERIKLPSGRWKSHKEDMQLICEAYQLMRDLLGMSDDEMHEVFAAWNQTELDSYLIEITRDILAYKDTDGQPIVEKILDTAGQKGTGKWTGIAALDEGVPLTLIGEAVFARCLSAMKAERVEAAKEYARTIPAFTGDKAEMVEAIRQALYASKIISYAQGYTLMRTAAKTYGWNLNYGGIALMWRGGCIIRSVFLGKIKEAYDKNPELSNLLLDPYFKETMEKLIPAWRKVAAAAVSYGVPAPAMTAALSYFDGYTTDRLPANLLQAQRDYFGAHTYERLDSPRGQFFHTNWTGHGGNTAASTYNA